MKKDAQAMLDFAKKYPGWHSLSNDAATRKAAKELAGKRLIELCQWSNKNWQFKYLGIEYFY